MRTECKQARFEFHGLFQRKVKARFDGGKITSDAGVLLLREVERGTGLIAGLAECFRDHRDPRLIEHTVEELLGQRIYGLCLGYEDLNDHDQLRTDPMLAVAVNKADPLGERRRQASDRGKALAGRCTLNRLELTGAEVDEQERYKKIAMDPDRIDGWMVDAFVESHESAPEEMVLDLDATDDPIHGQQEGRFFHGYYRHYCYLPLYIFSGEHLLCARLRCSNIDGAAGSVEELERIVGRIRQSWPEVSIVIRADSGFCRDDLLRWCEDHHVDYVMGLANNDRLKSERAEAMTQAEAEFNATGRPARVFKDFRYRTRHSWTSERRVVGKAEFLDKGANPRFVVTSLSPERLGARALYEDFYCARGRHGEPHKRTAVGSVRRPDQRGNDARQSTPAVSVLRRLHAHARLASSRTEADPPGSRSVSDDSLEAPQDRRPGPPHGPPRLDLHVGSLSLQRGLRCRRSKPPGHSSALLRSVPIKRPQKRNRSIAQAELCLNTFRHALPNPKNAPFTTIHTTASLDLDRIDSETLRKPFRPAKITFISKSVIYAG